MDSELLQRVEEKRDADDTSAVNDFLMDSLVELQQSVAQILISPKVTNRQANILAHQILQRDERYRTLIGGTADTAATERDQESIAGHVSPDVVQSVIDFADQQIHKLLLSIDSGSHQNATVESTAA